MNALIALLNKSLRFAAISFFLLSIGCSNATLHDSSTIDSPNALAGDSSSIAIQGSSAGNSARQEKEFQEDVNTLFNPGTGEIDTSGWCTDRINAGRFDYTTMTDTARLMLVDPLQNRFYIHPAMGYVTSPFGARGGFWHFGTDIKVNIGDTIRCALDGIVRIVTNDRRGYGRVVVVRHHNGLETIYGHLSKSSVTCNQFLKAGDPIGRGGNSGRSTGSHLHFEMRFYGEPFDPDNIIDFEYGTLKSDILVLSRSTFEYLSDLRKIVFHTIRSGETLSRIARRYGTSINKLCALNRISSKTVLKVGRKIIVRKDPSSTTREEMTLGAGDTPGT